VSEAIAIGDALPDVPVVTIHGETASLTEIQGPGPAVIVPFRGPW
jgi:peroxiredoxin